MLPLFVYGSLRKSYRNRYARLLWREGKDLGAARARGYVVRNGPYPGWRPPRDPRQWVRGELVMPASGVLGRLDVYEGRYVYRKRKVRLQTDGGAWRAAWIYEYCDASR